MKEQVKKLTLTQLIQNKEKYQVKSDTTEELFIDRLGGSITIRKPERSLCLECMEMANDEKRQEQADIHMVYNIVSEPNLKDPELHKEFGCAEPYDIVEKIFEVGEISHISGTGMELAGYHSKIKKVSDLKN